MRQTESMGKIIDDLRRYAGIEVEEGKFSKPDVIEGQILLTPRNVRRGIRVYGNNNEDWDWPVFKFTNKTVTIGSDSDVDAGARFSGKRYTYKWDGIGYYRQGKYLYVKE